MANNYTLPNGVEIGDDGAVDITVDVIDVEDLAFAHVCRSLREQVELGGGKRCEVALHDGDWWGSAGAGVRR